MTALEIARGELGVTELPAGSNRVKYNDWYYGRTVSGDAYPWCMAFVQWCFSRAGNGLPYKTASCSALLRWFRANCPEAVASEPAPGDIAIYNFGHTGIVESKTADTVTCIEGNTSESDASNGGAVLRCTRRRKTVTAFIRWEREMTGEEIYRKLCDYLKEKEPPEWAQSELREAVELGITDGSEPTALVPRYQAAIMAKRAVVARERADK